MKKIMKVIKVNNIESAAIEASKIILDEADLSSICLTGGRFGIELLKNLNKINLDIGNLEIFQTDERFLCDKQEIIQKEFNQYLSTLSGFNETKLNFFSYEEQNIESFQRIKKKIDKLKKKTFDLCFLSLGEDGHLAGNFINSHDIDNMFCLTKNAPKRPKNRVSFKISWLKDSKSIILVCLGKEKQKELNKLLQGDGLHSIILKRRIIIITDLEL